MQDNGYLILLMKYRKPLCRTVFTLILISLIYSFFSNTLLHQLQAPPLKYPYVDASYWIVHLLKLPEFITSHFYAACFFDILLFASCLASIFSCRRFWMLLFSLNYFIYFLIYNTYVMHHTHDKISLLLLPIPFLMKRPASFYFLWSGLRYYTCLIFSLAFIWKLFRGTIWFANEGILIMKRNLAPYLYFHPAGKLANFYYWLFQHPGFSNTMFRTGCLLEGVFILGLLTRKYDRLLITLIILIPFGFLIFADAYFFTLSLLALTFLPLQKKPSTNS